MVNILTNAIVLVTKINSLKHRLRRFLEVLDERYPGSSHLVPCENGIDVYKLKGGGVMSDTCNAAQKVRRILVDKILGKFDFDCMHHLHNVWFGNMEKCLTQRLNTIL